MPRKKAEAGTPAVPPSPKGRKRGMQKTLHDKLVLVRWALNELGIENLSDLTVNLKSEVLEGVGPDIGVPRSTRLPMRGSSTSTSARTTTSSRPRSGSARCGLFSTSSLHHFAVLRPAPVEGC
jgi:hypothetical protein